MPSISKIRFTNAIYDNGEKRYNDELFVFDGHNGAVLLENGGGKTTFIQIAIQAILPHADLGDRKIRDTLSLEGSPCHIAIEWIINEKPRRYALTAVTLYLNNGKLDSYKYVYEYGYDDKNSIENIPFIKDTIDGNKRPASREELGDYYQLMCREHINAKIFSNIKEYHKYIEENFKIIPKEWRRIGIINGEEGGIDKFFEGCRTTDNLVDKLLIPVVEEAMAGNGTEDFVSTFEEQREHFKQHKHLKESIDESRRIQDKIAEYVNTYSDHYKIEEQFNSQKSYGKALYHYISNEQKGTKIDLEDNIKAQDKYKYECNELNRMKDSYELALLKNKLSLSKYKYEEILKNFEGYKEQLDIKETRKQNLKIAKYKKNIKELEDEIILYQNQLKNLEKDEEINIIEEQLHLNSSHIKSYYDIEINKLNEETDILENQKKKHEEQLKNLKLDKEKTDDKYDELVESQIRHDQNVKTKTESMKIINKEILSNPEIEKIEDEYPKWSDKVGFIEKYSVDIQERIKYLKAKKNKLRLQLKEHREELDTLSTDKDISKEKINNIEEQEKELLLIIKENISNLFHINSIYTKQEQIISTLENKCEKLRKEKEDLIIKERLFHRFIDDYKDNRYFTVEPLLGKWIYEWKDQFGFLESGTKYIERVANTTNKSEKEYYKTYPYWAAIVVVADNEQIKLKNKLENNIDKITYPIIILSQSKAQEILKSDNLIIDDYICLYPSMWETNIVRKEFQYKKDEFYKNAKIVTQNRKDKENELNNYDNLHTKIIEFLNKYPYLEYLGPLKDKLKNIEEKIYDIKDVVNTKSTRIEQIDEEVENINKEIEELNMEKAILNKKIEKAMDYIKQKLEVGEIQNKIFELKSQINIKKIDISKLTKSIDNYEKRINNLENKVKEVKRSKDDLLVHEIYLEVENSLPIKSDISIEMLKRQRKDIKDRLDKKQKDRNHIEDNINKNLNMKKEYETNLKNEIKGAKYPIDEEIIFPIYGDKEIEELINEINLLNPKVEKIMREMENVKEEYKKDENNYDNRKDYFLKQHDEIMEFIEALEVVKEKINEKKQELDKRYEYLKSMEEELNRKYNSIKEALDILEKKNERYEYLANKVEPSILPEDITVEIPYNRKKYINRLIEDLENFNYMVKEKKERVSKEKLKFESFCNNSISDPRLKNMAISGINYKDDFEELTKWKRIMDKNIDKTIRILEEDMLQHDKEINHFITHLHSYLKTMIEEIRIIPKKTRIKVDDKWKEVYTIDVPTWEDEVGKQKLIDYINWLLKDIEDIRFKDEDGSENKTIVRKYIENKFQGKELLKVVMENEKIKVKCRKVTNDGKVSSIPVTWGKSNSWSGGERWSKNMSLFLGILNYLAEKSQSISTGQKRNRTVILDNPFGEASSDHVLDPVFFIAEQLGFQIIALTAHSEGKYIRDFFPVVYSCRLRPSSNNETQILTKEKEINYAFFKDNDPKALLRLGDIEQMSMI
ncbi:hypothetical protein [Proteiniborus sp.]|uniref:hypothetical protein n=1 Tax=Proteiniborus sp. TaxID=2079015 RepID=UPI00332763ED